MKNNRIVSGILLIAAAVLLLIIGIMPPVFGLSTAQLIGAFICVVIAVHLCTHHSAHMIFIPIAVLYVILEDSLAKWFLFPFLPISRWILVLTVILLCAGTYRIFGPKRPYSRGHFSKPSDCDYVDDGDERPYSAENSIGSKIRYVDASSINDTRIENNIGKLEVFIQNEENYPGGMTMRMENNLGYLVVHVPAAWNVIEKNSENQIGEIKIRPNTNPNGKTLFIQTENSIGKTAVVSP